MTTETSHCIVTDGLWPSAKEHIPTDLKGVALT